MVTGQIDASRRLPRAGFAVVAGGLGSLILVLASDAVVAERLRFCFRVLAHGACCAVTPVRARVAGLARAVGECAPDL